MTQAYRHKGYVAPDEELPKKKKQPSRWIKFKKNTTEKLERFNLYMRNVTSWENAFLVLLWIGLACLVAAGLTTLGGIIFTKDVISYCYIERGDNQRREDKVGFYLMANKDWRPDSLVAGPFPDIDQAKKYADNIECPMVRK